MIPNPKGFHNQFKVVKIPSVKSVFLRSGEVSPMQSSVDIDELGGVLPKRKNEILDDIDRLADQVPVNEHDE